MYICLCLSVSVSVCLSVSVSLLDGTCLHGKAKLKKTKWQVRVEGTRGNMHLLGKVRLKKKAGEGRGNNIHLLDKAKLNSR